MNPRRLYLSTTAALLAVGLPVVLGTLSLLLLIKRLRSQDGGRIYAPSIGCLPVVGSLPYLPDFRQLHRWALDKSYTLGAVFTFNVGNVYTVLLTSHEAIHEAFIQRSSDFAGRVEHFSSTIFNPQGKGIVLHPYDEEFKKYHQLSLSILKQFGFGRDVMEIRISTEVQNLIQNIKELNGAACTPKDLIIEAVQNILICIAYGQRLDKKDKMDRRFVELMLRGPDQFVNLLPLDILPLLRFTPFFRRRLKETNDVTDELFSLIDKKIDSALGQDDFRENFVSCFVEKDGKSFDRMQLKTTLRDLLSAGTETVSATIVWASVLLANHQEVQERLQREIDSVVDRDRLPSLDDQSKMTYVEATILELMRFKTVVPFGIPHATLRDSEVGGFFIPKNTNVFAVLHAVHMDVNVWDNPSEFRPDRFIDANGRLINKELVIPFSIGRRSCLGEMLARQEVYLFLTALLQQFHLRPPEGFNKVEYQEQMDLTLWPMSFQVRFIQRTEAMNQI